MYLDCKVKVPDEYGKITRFKKGKTVYIRYLTDRVYHPDKRYNVPNHKTIGKQTEDDPTLMFPNENFLKYFGNAGIPEIKTDIKRSSCLRIGAFLVIRRIVEQYGLSDILKKYLAEKDSGLFLDLAAYTIIEFTLRLSTARTHRHPAIILKHKSKHV